MSATLIIGGARSGKSRYGEQLALARSAAPLYVATSRIWDEDHANRVQRHRQERTAAFETLEVEKRLSQVPASGKCALVDCVTLWLTNYFTDADGDSELALTQACAEFDQALAVPDSDWIFVSNELGQGVHADSPVGRRFVDLQGFMNQHIASKSNEVWLMVAGIAMPVKSS